MKSFLSFQHSSESLGSNSQPSSDDELLFGPHPLGLNLRKSTSLIDLISSHLFGEAQDSARGGHGSSFDMPNLSNTELVLDSSSTPEFQFENYSSKVSFGYAPENVILLETGGAENGQSNPASTSRMNTISRSEHNDTTEVVTAKSKPSRVDFSSIRIGKWMLSIERGDKLLAKCYFSTQKKILWEFETQGKRQKIEILLENIANVRALYKPSCNDILQIELYHSPNFHEQVKTGPKYKWTHSKDFTVGQASSCLTHVLEFPEGSLRPLYENLLKCDSRVNFLVAENTKKRLRREKQKLFPSTPEETSLNLCHPNAIPYGIPVNITPVNNPISAACCAPTTPLHFNASNSFQQGLPLSSTQENTTSSSIPSVPAAMPSLQIPVSKPEAPSCQELGQNKSKKFRPILPAVHNGNEKKPKTLLPTNGQPISRPKIGPAVISLPSPGYAVYEAGAVHAPPVCPISTAYISPPWEAFGDPFFHGFTNNASAEWNMDFD